MGSVTKKLTTVSLAAVMVAGLANAEVVSENGGHTIDVGLDAPINVPADENLKVAFFIATVANNYVQAMVDEAKMMAADQGFELEVFDAQFNAQIQMDQLENVLENGDFNAWYVTPVDGNLMCDVVTKDAPSRDIVVATSNIAICGRDDNPFAEQWEPGLLTYVGAAETGDYLQSWMRAIAEEQNGAETKAIIQLGFAGITTTRSLEAAMALVESEYPNVEFVAQAYGDFTAAGAQASVETMLLANPEANVVISQYSDMTVGVVNALEDANRLETTKVYDIGAASDTLGYIKDGSITSSAIYGPRTHVQQTLGSIVDAWKTGALPARTMDGLPRGSVTEPYLVNAENVGDYTPEY